MCVRHPSRARFNSPRFPGVSPLATVRHASGVKKSQPDSQRTFPLTVPVHFFPRQYTDPFSVPTRMRSPATATDPLMALSSVTSWSFLPVFKSKT